MNPFAKSCTGPLGAAGGTAPTRGTEDPLPKPPNEFDGFTPEDKPPNIDEPPPEPALGLIPLANGEAERPRPAAEPTPGSAVEPDVAMRFDVPAAASPWLDCSPEPAEPRSDDVAMCCFFV